MSGLNVVLHMLLKLVEHILEFCFNSDVIRVRLVVIASCVVLRMLVERRIDVL